MNWRDRRWSCDCEADRTQTTGMIQRRRGRGPRPPIKKAMMVRHYRARDNAYFWHWSDQNKRLVRI